jgi:hypothetical protein
MSVEVCFRYMAKRADWKPVHKDAKGLRANWSKAFEKLRYELARINATDVVIEAGYKPSQVRADGWPYSAAKPEHGQVRVSFMKGSLSMSFFFGGWTATEMNAYMIALTLERLRAVERYGCVQSDEQYRGWAQLPPGQGKPSTAAAEWASIEKALLWLREIAGIPLTTAADPSGLYRAAAKKAHPDAGGSAELMSKVTRARDFIAGGGA